jgi:hypothetical protein
MSKKYQVSQNGTVYGNFYAHSDKEAIEKAYIKNGEVSSFNFNEPFDIKYDGKNYATFLED